MIELKAVVSGPIHQSLALLSTIVKNFKAVFQTWSTNIKAWSCCLFLVLFFLTKNGKISALSKGGMVGCLPNQDLDEVQSEFPDPIDEHKSGSCLFLVLFFWRPKMGKCKRSLKGWVAVYWDLDEGQSVEFPDPSDFQTVGFPDQHERSMNIKARVVFFFLSRRLRWLSGSAWTIDEYKSASCCLFLVLFFVTKNG